MAAAADIASEPKDQEETGKLSGFRMVAEGKFGLPALLSLTVPYGEEYIDTSMLRFLRARQVLSLFVPPPAPAALHSGEGEKKRGIMDGVKGGEQNEQHRAPNRLRW